MQYTRFGKASSQVTPLGASGYSLHFNLDSVQSLEKMRHFQQTVKAGYPGWLTRLETGPGNMGVVHVFPVSELPTAIFGRSCPYGQRA